MDRVSVPVSMLPASTEYDILAEALLPCHVITELHLSDSHCWVNNTVDLRCSRDIIIFWHNYFLCVSHLAPLQCAHWEKGRGQGQWIRRELEPQLRLTSSLCISRFSSLCLPSSPRSLFFFQTSLTKRRSRSHTQTVRRRPNWTKMFVEGINYALPRVRSVVSGVDICISSMKRRLISRLSCTEQKGLKSWSRVYRTCCKALP